MTADGGLRRLSVCYLVPGSDLDPSAGPSRNAVELARALGRWADVTLAFRRVPEDLRVEGIRLAEIDPGKTVAARAGDDSAIRGMGYREFARYLKRLRTFLDERLPQFDAVLEKSWLLSGYASDLARKRGVPAIPIENFVPVPGKGAARGGPGTYARQAVGRYLSGRALRRAPIVVAETEQLRRAMQAAWGLPPERLRVVGVGVDRDHFRPLDQAEARRKLGVAPDVLALLYVGILNPAHDLGPAIDAFVAAPPAGAELHVLGDGPARADCERRAVLGPGAQWVRFHGAVPHAEVPTWIGASDVCLAPYSTAFFPNGEVSYSTLKIREYLSAGRSVVSIPSGAILELVEEGRTGFLFDNDAESWQRFFVGLPSRERFRAMGEAAAQTHLSTWEDIGRKMHEIIQDVVFGAVRNVAV